MKDDTKFYIVITIVLAVLTLITIYWAWIDFGKIINPPITVQPLITEEPINEDPPMEDSRAICLQNPRLCEKG